MFEEKGFQILIDHPLEEELDLKSIEEIEKELIVKEPQINNVI